MTTTLWTCSINPFDKSSTKCTEDRCYRWDIWGSPNACKSCAATFLQIPLMHFFPLSAKSLYPMPGERGTKCEIFRLFLPSGRNILSDIVSSCHLSRTAATIYFAILRPNPVPRSFPCHWSGPPVPPNSGNPPLTLEKGTKKLLHLPPAPPRPPKKRKQRRQRNGIRANWATTQITILGSSWWLRRLRNRRWINNHTLPASPRPPLPKTALWVYSHHDHYC